MFPFLVPYGDYEIVGENYPYMVNINESDVSDSFRWNDNIFEICTIPLIKGVDASAIKSHLRLDVEPSLVNPIFYHEFQISENSTDQYICVCIFATAEGSEEDHSTGAWSGTMKLYYDDKLLLTINCPQITVE